MRPHPLSETAVTPLLGTILVLAISVAGAGVALFFGVPALTAIQQQGAAESMVGQFDAVRATTTAMAIPGDGREVDLSVQRGDIGLVRGTAWLVTVNQDASNPSCDFHIAGWADGDAVVQVEADDGCRDLVNDPQANCSLGLIGNGLPGSACVQVFRLAGAVETPIALAAVPSIGTTLVLAEPLDLRSDYVFRLTDRDDAVYAEAWLMRADALHWLSDDISLDLDSGALVVHGDGGPRVAAPPRVDERLGAEGPILLVLPTLRGDSVGLSGSGTWTLTLGLEGSYVRHQAAAQSVRIDLVGDNAAPLCQAFVDRSADLPVPWVPDGVDGACGFGSLLATVPAMPDDAVSFRFAPPPAGNDPVFVLTQMVYDVRLLP